MRIRYGTYDENGDAFDASRVVPTLNFSKLANRPTWFRIYNRKVIRVTPASHPDSGQKSGGHAESRIYGRARTRYRTAMFTGRVSSPVPGKVVHDPPAWGYGA